VTLRTGSVADLDAVLALLDCYAGDDGKLVRFYESAGFTRTELFDVNGWPGQLLERRA
jgi:hypothetical protein